MRAFITETASFYADAQPTDTVADMRARYHAYCRRFARPRPADVTAEDASVAAVPVRIYRPASRANEARACILYMHGGGWVLGSVDTHDDLTAEITARTGAVVISVDYRLAPEHPFPAAFNDCRAVLNALAAGAVPDIDPARIIVAGDSAGANLAAALTLAARDQGGPSLGPQIWGQALIYPALGTGTDFGLPSYIENATAPMLQSHEMDYYWGLYLGTATNAVREQTAAPLAATNYGGLPPALILTAGHDPVRDEGAVYAQRLQQAGVPVTYHCADDLPHGYLRARALSPSAAAEVDALCAGLRDMITR
jgi:acetyl esterase